MSYKCPFLAYQVGKCLKKKSSYFKLHLPGVSESFDWNWFGFHFSSTMYTSF